MAITSKINQAIAFQRFEQIRDRIVEILMVEIDQQKTLQTDPRVVGVLNNTTFYRERFRAMNESEMLAVAIFLFNADYDNKNQTSVRGTYTFFLDCFAREFHTQLEDGDEASALSGQSAIGFIRSILENPNWFQLGFGDASQTTFVNTTSIKSVKRTEEENTKDAGNIIMYRIIFEVVATEDTNFIEGVPLKLATTNVRLSETDQGFQYIYTP